MLAPPNNDRGNGHQWKQTQETPSSSEFEERPAKAISYIHGENKQETKQARKQEMQKKHTHTHTRKPANKPTNKTSKEIKLQDKARKAEAASKRELEGSTLEEAEARTHASQ